MAELIVIDVGRQAYARTLDLQNAKVAEAQAGPEERACLILVEHDPPVITTGRARGGNHILAKPEQLARTGIEVHRTARGGDVTYHGPGQLVGYPILRVDLHGRDVHRYLRDLEEVLIRLLGRFGIRGQRREGMTGIWVGGEKIAAIGVAFSRWVSYHGFALNVSPDLSHFDLIVPCGLRGKGVTSMSAVLGRDIDTAEIKGPLVECVAEVFGFEGVRKVSPLEGNSPPETPAPRAAPPREPLPPWLTRRVSASLEQTPVAGILADLRLATVCAGAHCPNQSECYAAGTATFLILGENCTRNCGFCAIRPGRPVPPRADEPEAVAEAAVRMGLRHVVITSVTRDDLPDGGAGHFARTIEAVRRRAPRAAIEVLTPDFQGREADIDTVLDAGPDVFNHNLETAPRLYPLVRAQADYRRSLDVLAHAAGRRGPAGRALHTKSGLMVGLGERPEEVLEVMRDLRAADCDVLTIGQYLAPSPSHLPVARFVEPAEFRDWKKEGEAMGFLAVSAGPFVRSSYRAETVLRVRRDKTGIARPTGRG